MHIHGNSVFSRSIVSLVEVVALEVSVIGKFKLCVYVCVLCVLMVTSDNNVLRHIDCIYYNKIIMRFGVAFPGSACLCCVHCFY